MTLAAKTTPIQPFGTSVVQAYGRGRHVELTLDDEAPLAEVEHGLRSYLAHTAGRFTGGRVTLNLGRRVLDPAQVRHLTRLLEEEFHLALSGLWCGPETLEALLSDRPLPAVAAPPPEPPRPRRAAAGVVETLLVRGTCRSGTTIHNNGNVVVLGDVNPGAEITAVRDVIVFGKLRGLAHAGVNGADDAVIVAHSIEAHQVRIGPYIRTETKSSLERRAGRGPEVALVAGGRIVIEPYTARFKWSQEG